MNRVVILGGGVGGVVAALQLSKPGWKTHYDSITLYQQGWRLGGKGASGRGQDLRIEEHGLHIWFGFYENAFRILDRCHQELDAIDKAGGAGSGRWPLAFQSVEASFSASGTIGLTDHDGCCWSPWLADFPVDPDDDPWRLPDPRPPAERPDQWSVAHYLRRTILLAAAFADSIIRSDEGALEILAPQSAEARSIIGAVDTQIAKAIATSGDSVQQVLGVAAELVDALAGGAAALPLTAEVLEVVLGLCDRALDLLRTQLDPVVRGSDAVRRAWYMADVLLAMAKGIVADGVLESGDLQDIDHMEFRAWLRFHGASQESISCALIRSVVYDLAFAFEGGDPQRPSCGAGTALRGLLRTFFTYRGSLMYKMNAGMGDVVFAPIYELLVKRGVEVEFFHRVEELKLAGGAVQTIRIDRQVDVPPGTEPRRYLEPGGSGGSTTYSAKAVWPADAAHVLGSSNVIAASKKTKAGGSIFESWYANPKDAKAGQVVLTRGAPSDGFETVVYAMPITTVPACAPDLLAIPRWKDAVARIKSVPTQAMQLWIDRKASQLGDWPDGVVVGGFVEPYDTWADMPHLCSEEHVKGCQTIAYFCNVLWDAPPPARGQADAWMQEQLDLVEAQALRFLRRDVKVLWPKAVDPLTGALDWNVLVAPTGAMGEARLAHQYLRANVEPTERYVLSVPGSSAYRIPPDDTGVANLYVAGDWTENTINAGCVEAATISGMVAANAIHVAGGWLQAVEPIIGRPHP